MQKKSYYATLETHSLGKKVLNLLSFDSKQMRDDYVSEPHPVGHNGEGRREAITRAQARKLKLIK